MTLAVRIVRYLGDEPQPGLVAAEFTDAAGRCHTLIDKVPIFCDADLDAASAYPREGGAACEVLARWEDAHGRALARISTVRPDGIESSRGVSEFVVLAAQLR